MSFINYSYLQNILIQHLFTLYGKNVHLSVLNNKETESGITIHLVNKNYDDGKILFQKHCFISSNETPSSLSKKVLALEHKYFPVVIKNYIL